MSRRTSESPISGRSTCILTASAVDNTTTVAPGVTTFMTPAGSNTGETAIYRMPFPCQVLGFRVGCTASPGAGQTFVYTLRKNSGDTALTATISEAETSALNNSVAVSYADGDTWTVKLVTSAGANQGVHGCQFLVERA